MILIEKSELLKSGSYIVADNVIVFGIYDYLNHLNFVGNTIAGFFNFFLIFLIFFNFFFMIIYIELLIPTWNTTTRMTKKFTKTESEYCGLMK